MKNFERHALKAAKDIRAENKFTCTAKRRQMASAEGASPASRTFPERDGFAMPRGGGRAAGHNQPADRSRIPAP